MVKSIILEKSQMVPLNWKGTISETKYKTMDKNF